VKILYLGDDNPRFTSAHRAQALHRLGHEITIMNPMDALPNNPVIGGTSTRVGYWPFVPWVNSAVRRFVGRNTFDLAWIDSGAALSPGLHKWLRRRGMAIVNYNIDDPFGNRDGRKWNLYLRSVALHDLTVVVRDSNVHEARAAGATKVVRVFMSYDPVAHAPIIMSSDDRARWSTEVVFVGSWMPERGPFVLQLLESGIPLTIFGDHWEHAAEWSKIRSIVRGPAVQGTEYVKAIQGAKVALGLLSKGNRDLHTTRSSEIPFIGGAVFCAERTSEHEAMYQDGKEAIFWSSAAECAKRCFELLADPLKRRQITTNARNRVLEMQISNDETLAWIIESLRNGDSVEARLVVSHLAAPS
jgi:spore maturation protein CgeB